MDTQGSGYSFIHAKGSEPFPGTGLSKRDRVVSDITIPSSSGLEDRPSKGIMEVKSSDDCKHKENRITTETTARK